MFDARAPREEQALHFSGKVFHLASSAAAVRSFFLFFELKKPVSLLSLPGPRVLKGTLTVYTRSALSINKAEKALIF
jgi:Cys-tRNA synthase (O-phospho-L-seryl-tRNA:Cys-tRNA synthase)